MKHFKQLVKELPAKKVVFTFGRFQPPTIGHGLLVTAVKHIAQKQGADHVIYASRSQDKKSNPLPVDRKVYYLKRMFPGSNFVGASEQVRTFMEAAKELNKKYKNLVMVAGSDRVPEYKKLLEKYNGKDFHFDTIEVVSAGERDPDADGATGMSGTKMRDAAKKGDLDLFKKGLPSTLTQLDAKRLMNEIREGMGIDAIKEEITFDTNDLREAYHRGEIFTVGEKVEDDTGVYEIVDRGTNYISVVNESGEISKKWIHTVKSFKNIVEDIQPGYASDEISFKGYTTKNLHHSADAAKAFQATIERYKKGQIKDAVAILNALKATDTYMKLNDLHLEQGKALDNSELSTWNDAHQKARQSLNRIGEFMHHMDYWHMHEHELQGLETKFTPATAGEEFADSYELQGNLLEMKYTSSDKIKVARVIAGALGIEEVEKSSNPEQLINNGLRKVRSKPMRPEYVDVLHNMLETAKEAGIKFDEKLVPQKVTEGVKQPNGTDKVGGIVNEISKETLKSYIPKAMGSKSAADFTRGVKMAQGSGGEEELRKKSEKRSAGIHTAIKKLTKEELQEAEYWKNKSWQKKMSDAAKKERQAREKKEAEQVKEEVELTEAIQVSHDRYIRSHGKTAEGKGLWAFTHKKMGDVNYNNDSEYHKATGSFSDAKKSAKMWAQKHGHSKVYVMEQVDIAESRGQADKHWDDAEAHLAKAKKHKEGTEQYHGHMSAHFDSKSQYHSELGQYQAADKAGEKAEEHHEKMLKAVGVHKEEVELEEAKTEKYGFFGTHNPKIGDRVTHKPTGATGTIKHITTQGNKTHVTFKSENDAGYIKKGESVNTHMGSHVKVHKEEVELEEGKMGELHDTISRHLDKHISDFKSGHTGMDQFGSKVLAAHKHVAKAHGLEHKHAAKFVNDYVDSKLNEEAITEWVVKHDGVPADHPDYAIKKQFHGKKDVINHLTKYKSDADQRANYLKKKGFQNVRIEEGKDYSVTVTHYADGKHVKHEYAVKNANDYKHAKHIALQRHGKKIGTLKQGEQYGASNMDVKELNKESYSEISDLLEQIATAAMMGKDTHQLKKQLKALRDKTPINTSDVEAQEKQTAAPETAVGQSMTAPHEDDTVRKMKVGYQTEECSKKAKADLDEDQATAEYKVKTYYDNALGKTITRKVRPHIVTFKNSKKGGEPEVNSPGEDEVKEGVDGYPAGDMGSMPIGAPEPFSNDPSIIDPELKKKLKDKKALNLKEEEEDDDLSTESDLDDMAAEVQDLDDIIDVYGEDELILVDDEGNEIKEEFNEEALNEVLSRIERMRAKIRFAQSKSKRERKIKIALKTPSSMNTLNSRARKLAVNIVKQRLARKPLNKLSVSEKERIEKIVQKRKKLINRLAMKLVSRVKKIEQTRLHRG